MATMVSCCLKTAKENYNKIAVKCQGRKVVDFNILVPMPEELENAGAYATDDTAMYFYLSERCTIPYETVTKNPLYAYIKNDLAHIFANNCIGRDSKYELNKMYNRGRECIEFCIKYGYPSWYEWAIANWGSKWNASNITITDNEIHFDTADVPTAWLKALSEAGVDFTMTWRSEGGGRGTETSAKYRSTYNNESPASLSGE